MTNDNTSDAAPDAGGHGLIDLARRYFSPLSALSLLGVIVIFALCAMLWDVAWMRPYLAAGGAGLAAFLGPIPGIISPEARAKWLASVIVAAMIMAGTWLATRDLEDRLDGASAAALAAERATVKANETIAAARETDAAHDAFVVQVLSGLPGEARGALFKTASLKFWALYNQKERKIDAKDNQIVLDMALMMLEIDRNNGHALYFAGEAYAKLGDPARMIRMLQHYLAGAETQTDAASGQARLCYDRASGYCAERVGWVAHMLADAYLTAALAAPEGDRAAKLALAFDYEAKAVRTVKWPAAHHHPGFDSGGITPGYSSCKILLTLIDERRRLAIDVAPVVQFGQTFLTDKCGPWPAL